MATKPRPAEWREQTLDRIRSLILEADPEMIEERKWRKPSNGMAGVPVWSHDGIVEGEKINEKAFKALIKAAVRLNGSDRD